MSPVSEKADKMSPKRERLRQAIREIEECVIQLDAHMQTSGTPEEMEVIGEALIEDLYNAIRRKREIEAE